MSFQVRTLNVSRPEQRLAFSPVEGDAAERERREWVGDRPLHGMQDGLYYAGLVVFQVVQLVVGFATLLEHFGSGHES